MKNSGLLKLMMVFLLALSGSAQAFCIRPPYAPGGVLFEEHFDGLTALPPDWVTYIEDSWDMILPQNDEVIFFKQSTGTHLMILSTPLIDLTNASQMTFRFRENSGTATLKVGLMSDPANPNTFQLLTQFQIDTAMALFTVPLGGISGTKHIAFNWVGPYFKAGYLDDVIVYDNGVQNNVPSNVTNPVLSANPGGVNTATLSWVNPSLQADGDPLTDLDSVVVALNGARYAVLMAPPIGAPQNIQVTVPYPAVYSATLTPYNTAGEGIPNTTTETWVGLDIPAAPRNVILSQVGNHATLRWSPPDSGLHGGYFNGLVNFYSIRRADLKDTVIAGSDTVMVTDVTDPGTFNYQVKALNASGASPSAASNTGVFLTGNYLLWEDFWVSVPAHRWFVQGFDFYNWWLYASNLAGGAEPEMLFQGSDPPNSGYSRMASPPLNTTGMNAVTLEFRHAHTVYSPYTLRIETSSDSGAVWHSAHAIPVTHSIPGTWQSVVITTPDVGSDQFRFSFTFEGSENDLESFSIDNVRLSPTVGFDVAANEVILPSLIHPGDAVVPKGLVQSLGINSVGYKALLTIRGAGGEIYRDSVSPVIQPGAVDTIAFLPIVMPEGELRATLRVSCIPDNNPANDTAGRNFVSYNTYPRSLVVLEEATGTWCTYCPGASMGIADLISHQLPVVAVAYHGGDPYQTPEGRARLNYYPAITGFPTVLFDGLESYVGGTHSTSMYSDYLPFVQQRLTVPTPVKVNLAGAELANQVLTADVAVESLSPIRNNNLVVHAVLTESKIPEAWQDQTELNDVERAMMADSTGTPVDLSNRSAQVAVTMPVNASWVRENLRLVVFVQDKATREILAGAEQKPVIGGFGEIGSTWKIFPNPASEVLCVRGLARAKADLFDGTGRFIRSLELTPGEVRIPVFSLAPGLYSLVVREQGRTTSLKFMVTR